MVKRNSFPHPTLEEELELWKRGYSVIGIDEVGRGAFAGPLVVGAVVFPPFFSDKDTPNARSILNEVRDSKMLVSKKREALVSMIREVALTVQVAEVSVSVINKVGIGIANQIGFRKAIQKAQKYLNGKKLFVLVDGFHARYVRGIGLRNQKAIIKGDQKSVSIASASIIAKVYRDSLMSSCDKSLAMYQFSKHKGYGTKLHQGLLKKYGVSPFHRQAFCRNILP